MQSQKITPRARCSPVPGRGPPDAAAVVRPRVIEPEPSDMYMLPQMAARKTAGIP